MGLQQAHDRPSEVVCSTGQSDDLGADSKKAKEERRGRKLGSLGKKKQSLTNLSASQSASGISSLTAEASSAPQISSSSSEGIKSSSEAGIKSSISMPTFTPATSTSQE